MYAGLVRVPDMGQDLQKQFSVTMACMTDTGVTFVTVVDVEAADSNEAAKTAQGRILTKGALVHLNIGMPPAPLRVKVVTTLFADQKPNISGEDPRKPDGKVVLT